MEPVLIKAQADLRYELDRYAKGTFSHTQRSHTLLLINMALAQLYNNNVQELSSQAQDFNDFGSEMANLEVKTFQKQVGLSIPNVKRDKVALDHNSFLINTIQTSLANHTVGIRMQISNALTDAVVQKKSGYEVSGRIGKKIDLEMWRIRRIVRTEMSKIYNATKHLAYADFDKKNFNGTLMKRMFHPMDSRTASDSKQWAKADPAIPMDKKFRLKLKSGKVQEALYPPMRPNDRAVLMPFHKSWKND